MGRAYVDILLVLTAVKVVLGTVCPSQFVQLGNFCYHFSNYEEDWEGARGYCNGIGAFEEETIILGVLDVGIGIYDNQLLLANASEKGGSYWLGGSWDGMSNTWRWIDHSNREINRNANYWHADHPTSEGECGMLTHDRYRSYLKATDCSVRTKVICQIIPKEMGFRTIGQEMFYFSSENNIAQVNTWQGARDFCLSLQPPNSFDIVDLITLGLNNELDQELLNVIAGYGNDVWLGGTHIANGNSGFAWIDNRTIDESLYFWGYEYTTTNAVTQTYWTYAGVTSVNRHARSTIKFCCTQYISGSPEIVCPSSELNFVCQAYKNE